MSMRATFDHAPNELALNRFLAHIQEKDGCWEWTGARTKSGYAVVTHNATYWRAHRLAVLWAGRELGKWPEVSIDHLCRNRLCVRPSHLDYVSLRENQRRGSRAYIRCRKGHRFTPENTIVTKVGKACRKCRNANNLAFYYRTGKAKRQEKNRARREKS